MRKKRERNAHLRIAVTLLLVVLPALAAAETLVQEQVGMVKALIPSLKKITILCDVTDVQPILRAMKSAADSNSLELQVFDVRTFPELHKVFRTLTSRTTDLIWLVPDRVTGADKMARRFLQENCLRMRIPLHASSMETLREGALLYMSMENGVPVFYVNQAVAGLMGFEVPPEMKSKITIAE